jgi:putative glutamine amidotransferase
MTQLLAAPPIIWVVVPPCREFQPERLDQYVRAIECAGGLCLLAPISTLLTQISCSELSALCHGILFIGGGDVTPKQYGGAPNPWTYGIDALRDEVEISLVQRALAAKIPILGICRGQQIMAVATGGTLCPHLSEPRYSQHRTSTIIAHYPARHIIHLQAGSKLRAVTGSERRQVISWHHCSVEQLPNEWLVTAMSDDGIIEAFEHKRHPFAWGLQFHAEMSGNAEDRRIFEAFIAASAAHLNILPHRRVEQ